MVRTRSRLGNANGNHLPEPQVIECQLEVGVAPEPITMAGVQEMTQMMLDH